MAYEDMQPSGADTGASLNLQKRLALIQRYIDIRHKKIIDCGCGAGRYVEALWRHGADVYGVECEEAKVARFWQKQPDLAARVRLGNIEALDFEAGSFDLALLNEVLEHVPDEARALGEIHRVLKAGGLLAILSPNRLYPFETHAVYLKRSHRQVPIYVPFIPYIPLPLGEQVFTYVARNYWPWELRRKVRAAGFTVVGAGYLWQTFENISGTQPWLISLLKPMLRKAFAFFERLPIVRVFGVSQVVIARK